MEEKTTQVTIKHVHSLSSPHMHASSDPDHCLNGISVDVIISKSIYFCLAMSGSSSLSTQTIDEALEDDGATSVGSYEATELGLDLRVRYYF